ncbi:MAG: DUF2237 family protein, partial [Xanthomonadales bacterium]|nr:DUF2237 family protein [Xanthomonadales bacterium]
RWCLCAARWREALEAGKAPRVVLQATHISVLGVVYLEDLKRYAEPSVTEPPGGSGGHG